MCEHHMLPFFGKAHIAYIPNGTIVGLSKIPRVVDAYARRLQVQERLTIEIRDCIQRTLKPKGVAVVIECCHMCMAMRGVQKQNSSTTSSAFTGLFLKNDATRKEFINLIQSKFSRWNIPFILCSSFCSVRIRFNNSNCIPKVILWFVTWIICRLLCINGRKFKRYLFSIRITYFSINFLCYSRGFCRYGNFGIYN